MATRKILFLGSGFGSTPATVTASIDGVEIFNGPVTTLDQPIPNLPDANLSFQLQNVKLFKFDTDTSFSGPIALSFTVNSGTVIFAGVTASYVAIANPVYTAEQIETLKNPSTALSQKVSIWTSVATPAFTTEELEILNNPSTPSATVDQILVDHNCQLAVSSGASTVGLMSNVDPVTQVEIDSVPQTPDRTGGLNGMWSWVVPAESTLACNVNILPAVV